MDTLRFCPQCQQPLPANAPEGLCPQCLIKAAAAPPSELQPVTTSGPGTVDIGNATEVAKRLPQFEIVELLGRGGMGVVYKARQLNLDRIVALKILPPAEAMSADFIERFRREARSLAKLSHPNIVTVYEFGESGGLYYFVMEFVDGVNLREMIRSHRLTPPEALAVVPKICDALQFAHEEGVVHRDIKPENILIDKRGRVKIADFGLAKLLRRDQADHTLTMSGMTLGTPRYMAPEQLDKPETVDHRADIYSLGVVFYEMLTGEVPMGRFAPPSEKVRVDVKLDEIVLRSLERDVERRYQHASEVKTDVENVTGILDKLPPAIRRQIGFEFKSRASLFGLPLLHVTQGIDPATGRGRTARGIIAIGGRAVGVVAMGGTARGVIAIGGLAMGLLALGGLSLGVISMGGLALALLFAYGGFAVAPYAFGGVAGGYVAAGGVAFGPHASGPMHNDPLGDALMRDWSGPVFIVFWVMFAASMIAQFAAFWWAHRAHERAGQSTGGPASRTAVASRNQPGTGGRGTGEQAPPAGANLLLVGGILTILSAVLTALLLMGVFVDRSAFDTFFRQDSVTITLLVMQTLALPCGVMMIIAGTGTATSSGLARAAAKLACLPLTPAWLFTLPLGIAALSQLPKAAGEPKAESTEPRLNRCALVGALLVPLWVVSVVHSSASYFTVAQVNVPGAAATVVSERPGWSVPFAVAAGVIALVAPFVSAILGGIAIGQIRRSAGRMYGLRLAAVACLTFPVLLLGVLAFFGTTFAWSALGLDKLGQAHLPVPEALVALIVCVLAGWAGWRMIAGRDKTGTPSVGAPAVWMLIGSVANLLMVLFLASETWGNYTKGQFTGAGTTVRFAALAALAALAATALYGALKMLGRDDYAASRRAAICSLFSIFGIITLPAGIWSLVQLSKPEVKALFPQGGTGARQAAVPVKPRHLLSAILALLALGALLFGLSFEAKMSATAAGPTKIVTVGAFDPLYFSQSGPSGFQTGFNFFSWSFFAVVVGGVAFSALWRITREDRGKVPRDPAWWHDWWMQVGIWGGLVLIACIVRTVMHPEKVLRPSGERTVDAKFTKRGGDSTVKPAATAGDVRRLLATDFKNRPEVRADVEQTLRDMGVPFSSGEKPEELVKKLEELRRKLESGRD